MMALVYCFAAFGAFILVWFGWKIVRVIYYGWRLGVATYRLEQERANTLKLEREFLSHALTATRQPRETRH